MRTVAFIQLQCTNVNTNTVTRSVNTATFWTRTAAKPVNASILAKTFIVTKTKSASKENAVRN